MTEGQEFRERIQHQWSTVKKLCESSHRQWASSSGFVIETPLDAHYNLPLVLAYCALDDALKEVCEEKKISSYDSLGGRMAASKKFLVWQDYALVFAGKEARNELAHEGKLLSKSDCFRYIAAIELELVGWGLVVGT